MELSDNLCHTFYRRTGVLRAGTLLRADRRSSPRRTEIPAVSMKVSERICDKSLRKTRREPGRGLIASGLRGNTTFGATSYVDCV